MRAFFKTVLLCVLAFPATAGQTPSWSVRQTPVTRTLYRLAFLDSLRGWVVGDSGTIMRTTDGGLAWTVQPSGVTAKLVDVQMLDERRGWAIGYVPLSVPGEWSGSYLLATADGGATWDTTAFPGEIFYAVAFTDSLHGWIGGEYGRLLGTADGGLTWTPAAVDSSSLIGMPVRCLKFVTPELGFGVGGVMEYAGVIWRTTDGGARWVITRTGEVLYDLWYFNTQRLIAVGGGYDDGVGVSQTTDGGAEWHFGYVGPYGQATGVSFRTKAEGWASLGFAGAVMSTFDGGVNWGAEYTPDRLSAYDVVFTDSRHGYMAGGEGRFFVYNLPATVTVSAGWNMLSVPVRASDSSKSAVFPSAVAPAFRYGPSGYEIADTLETGAGYWLRFAQADEVSFRGSEVLADTVQLRTGWNLVGSLSAPVSSSSVTTLPGGLIVSPFYGYAGGYQPADTVLPGRAYWVKAAADGAMILKTP